MPVFEIGLDDGRKLRVEADDQSAALAGVQHFLGNKPQQGGVIDAAQQGAADMLRGFGETGKRYLGAGDALKNAGDKIAPAASADTTLYDDKGLHLGNLPNAIAESSPSVAAAIAAARLTPGPLWAKLAAGGVVGLGQMAGNYAKDATAKRTGDANAPSNTEDLVAGATRAAPEAAIQSLPLGRFLPAPAARLGLRGVVGSLGRTAVDAAAMGGASAGAQGYDQLSQDGQLDPTKLIDAGIRGAAVGGTFGAGRTFQDAKAAVKFRGISDEDPSHISEAANRVVAANENLNGNLNNTKHGGEAIKSAQTDVATELKTAVANIKGSGEDKVELSQDAANVLARAQKGLPISDADATTLAASSGNSNAVADLQRLSGIARVLQGAKETGYQNPDGSLAGGLSGAMGAHMRAFTNPVGVGVAAGLGLGHLGDVVSYSPHAFAALAGTYGLARALDWATGNRSTAKAFTDRFADPSVGIQPSQVGTGAGQAALAQQASRLAGESPTGPKIGLNQPWSPPPATAPAAPPQTPQFNPVAMAMLKKAMANPPQAPQAPAAPAPVAPQMPQLNPVAMAMLKKAMANPPQAPQPQQAPPEAPPQLPQISPLALRMLRERLANPPQAPAPPQAAAVQQAPAAVPAKVVKSKGEVKVDTQPEPAPTVDNSSAAQAPAPAAVAADDLTIPDFLRRQTPTQPSAQKTVASQAMKKLNGIDFTPGKVPTAKELAMNAPDYSKHIIDSLGPADLPKVPDAVEKYRGAIERNTLWKQQTAVKLARAITGDGPPNLALEKQIYAKLLGTHTRLPIRQFRAELTREHPDHAQEINTLLSEEQLTPVWRKVGVAK